MNEATVISTRGLTKQFGEEYAVRDVSVELPPGKIFGLIGPSGCGKTTVVRLLTGTYEPTAGEVSVLSSSPTDFSAKTRRRIGYMPQLFVLYPDLTISENIDFIASIYGLSPFRWRRINRLLDFVELREHRKKLVREVSGGMQRRMSLAATLVHNPELIFLDEPTAGIDPLLRRKFWDYFRELQKEGRTLFVTTQYVGEAAYCDWVGIMAAGALAMVDTPEGLRSRAYGGQMVDLRTRAPIERDAIVSVYDLPFIKGRVTRLGPTSLRLVVDQANSAIPDLLEWAKQRNIALETIEEYRPPFDDVFVELVKTEKTID